MSGVGDGKSVGMAGPRVFVSYEHGSDEDRSRVLEFAMRLREDGIDCQVDRFVTGTPDGGWLLWMQQQLRGADYVLVVCSERYRRILDGDEAPEVGSGIGWEARLVRNLLYKFPKQNAKFVPLLWGDSPVGGQVPELLLGAASFRVPSEYDDLLAHLRQARPADAVAVDVSLPAGLAAIDTRGRWRRAPRIAALSVLGVPVVLWGWSQVFGAAGSTGDSGLPPFLEIPTTKARWVDFGTNYLRLEGRAEQSQPFREAFDDLDRFVARPEPLLWWWLNGPAGSGKTPLLHAWIKFRREQGAEFVAGFYRDHLVPDWRAWQPKSPTIIVIDDVDERIEVVDSMLRALCERNSDLLRFPVRVILVARTVPDSLQHLSRERIFNRHLHGFEPLVPAPFQLKHLRALAGLFERRGSKLVLDEREEQQLMHMSSGQPLIMVLGLDSLARTGRLDWELHGELLRMEAATYRRKLAASGVSAECEGVLMLATFVGGATWTELEGVGQDLGTACSKGWIDGIFGRSGADSIPAIEPWILGEYLLLEEYRELNSLDRDTFVRRATQLAPVRGAVTLLCLLATFPSHESTRDLLERLPSQNSGVPWQAVQPLLSDGSGTSLEKAAALLLQLAGEGFERDPARQARHHHAARAFRLQDGCPILAAADGEGQAELGAFSFQKIQIEARDVPAEQQVGIVRT